MCVCNAQNVLKLQGHLEIPHGYLKFARFLCTLTCLVYLGIVSEEKQHCLHLKNIVCMLVHVSYVPGMIVETSLLHLKETKNKR